MNLAGPRLALTPSLQAQARPSRKAPGSGTLVGLGGWWSEENFVLDFNIMGARFLNIPKIVFLALSASGVTSQIRN